MDTVPAGLTAMQALDRVADVKTRYGGRFVQAIGGAQGSLSARRDWFYFVNGIEGDRSAAEVRLRAGDVEWWDSAELGERPDEPAGRGRRLPEAVPARRRIARRSPIRRAEGRPGRACAFSMHAREGAGAERVFVVSRPIVFHGVRDAAGKVTFTISAADALRLARNPKLARFRYEGLP